MEDNEVSNQKLLMARSYEKCKKIYIKGCDLCQRMKNRIEAPVEKLMGNEVLEKVWIHLMVDFITKLSLVVGKDVILVVCDRLSKITYFVATRRNIGRGISKIVQR